MCHAPGLCRGGGVWPLQHPQGHPKDTWGNYGILGLWSLGEPRGGVRREITQSKGCEGPGGRGGGGGLKLGLGLATCSRFQSLFGKELANLQHQGTLWTDENWQGQQPEICFLQGQGFLQARFTFLEGGETPRKKSVTPPKKCVFINPKPYPYIAYPQTNPSAPPPIKRWNPPGNPEGHFIQGHSEGFSQGHSYKVTRPYEWTN